MSLLDKIKKLFGIKEEDKREQVVHDIEDILKNELEDPVFKAKYEKMRKECSTVVIISGESNYEEPLWCGAKYATEVYHKDRYFRTRSLGTFYITRDSTMVPYNPKQDDSKYAPNHEPPPGIYYASRNRWTIKGSIPELKHRVYIG